MGKRHLRKGTPKKGGGGLVATAADNEIRTKIDPRSDHQSKYGKMAIAIPPLPVFDRVRTLESVLSTTMTTSPVLFSLCSGFARGYARWGVLCRRQQALKKKKSAQHKQQF